MMQADGPVRSKAIAVFGTASDVGKSVVATALGRLLHQRGFAVAPFKAQNMSNNSFVTRDGGEMGRAQVVQAEACGVEPHTDMNPVLLKPSTDVEAQVIVHGRAVGRMAASEYFKDTSKLLVKAKESLARLQQQFDIVVIEGAGSCAEVNLRDRDIVNFEIAHFADAPVVLVADIDRGGVFAQIVGTLAVLSEADRRRIRGFVINRFRGDPKLFDDGIAYLEKQTGLPVLGLIPYYRHIEIDAEDSLPREVPCDPHFGPLPGKINIAAVRFPHISNATDFSPLIRDPAVFFHYVSKSCDFRGYDAVILPGSKNVRFDLEWLRSVGLDTSIAAFVQEGGSTAARTQRSAGGVVVGVCGGYQMLGHQLRDPHNVEGTDGGSSTGLGYLDVDTELAEAKVLTRSAGHLVADGTVPVGGYEIHMGVTTLRSGGNATPFAHVDACHSGAPRSTTDGAVAANGRIWGTYFHGLFDDVEFRTRFLQGLRPAYQPADMRAGAAFKETQYELLAEHFGRHLRLDLWEIVGLSGGTKPPTSSTAACL